jgi:hypothetical protein
MGVSRRTTLWSGLAVVGAIAIGGCGDGGGGGSDDPATIAPADAAFYADVIVRPEGEQKERVEAFVSRVLGDDDPGGRIEKLIDQGFKDAGEDATFAEDVEPWLGDNAAVFVTGFEDDPPAAVAVSSDDPDAGIELLESESQRTSDKDYEGTSYKLDEEGNAFGAVEDFVVFGDEPAFKSAVDASDGESLSDSDEYSDAVGEVDEDAVATAYINTEGVARQVAQEQDVPEDAVKEFFGRLGSGAAAAGVTVDDEQLTANVTAPGEDGGEPETSALLESLPADAFAAVGLDDIRGRIDRLVKQIESAGIPNVDEGDLSRQLQERFDIDLKSDLLSWLGDGALFLSGTSIEDLGGALVLDSRDPTASAGLIAKLATLIQREDRGRIEPLKLPGGGEGFNVTELSDRLPEPVHVVQRDDRLVIGYKDELTELGFASDEQLSENDLFSSARDAVGSDHPINFFIEVGPLLGLLDAVGASEDPNYAAVRKYLGRLEFLGAGTDTSDDRSETRIVVGAK